MENLNATKVVATATENGEVTDIIEAPDYRVRQAAVGDGYRLWGHAEKKENEEPNPPCLIMYVSLTRAEWISRVSAKPVHELFKGVRILNDDEDHPTNYPSNGTGPPAPIDIKPVPEEATLHGAAAIGLPSAPVSTDEDDEGVAVNMPEEDD